MVESRRPAAPSVDAFGDPLPEGARFRLGSARLRHADRVRAVAFSPDGKSLASGGWDGMIRVWDVATGKPKNTCDSGLGWIYDLAYSPDGRHLVAGADRVVRAFHTKSMTVAYQLEAGRGRNYGVAFSPDGKLLAASDSEVTVRVWDWNANKQLLQLRGQAGDDAPVRFSPDGKYLAAPAKGGVAILWELATGKEVRTFTPNGPNGVYTGLAFSPDGKTIATCHHYYVPVNSNRMHAVGATHLWDLRSGKRVREIPHSAKERYASSVAYSPDGAMLAVSYMGGAVQLWNPTTGDLLQQLQDYRHNFGDPYQLAFSPDGKLLACAGNDNVARLWETATGRALFRAADEHEGAIKRLHVTPDGKTLVAVSNDHRINFWDVNSQALRQSRVVESWINTSDLSKDGKIFAFGGGDGHVHLWETASATEIRRLPKVDHPEAQVIAIAFAPDGKRLFATYGEWLLSLATARLWDLSTGKMGHELDVPGGLQEAAAFSADGKTVSAINTNRGRNDREMSIRRWNVETGKETLRAAIDPNDCFAVFSADGRTFATSAHEMPITIWDTETGRRRFSAGGDAGSQSCLAFSPNGHFLASAPRWRRDSQRGDEQFIRIWELTSGKQVRALPLPKYCLTHALVYSPDGKTLYSGLSDTTILAWDVDPSFRAPASKEIPSLWGQLASTDAAEAYRAEVALPLAPEATTEFFRAALRPIVADERAKQLIANLDHDDFDVREKATRELGDLGERAADALVEALARSPSQERRRRIEAILESQREPVASQAVLQCVRAVRVLERIGTPAAREVLTGLTRGTPSARVTREANEALGRMGRKESTAP
jgi:WD40 repeat protein